MPRQLPDYLPADWPDYAPIPIREEWLVACEEDRIAEAAFRQMREHPRPRLPASESIAARDAHMAEAVRQSAAEVVRQIESKELLTAEEFCARSDAMRFRAKLDTQSTANWTPGPRQTGNPFQHKSDTDSAPNWTV